MKIRTYFYVIILLSVSQTGLSQSNLIPNPSFEEYTSCNLGGGQYIFLTSAQDWFTIIEPTGSLAPYFHACTGIPGEIGQTSLFGYQLPKSGFGMAGLAQNVLPDTDFTFNDFAAIKLYSPLQRDSIYVVSYYVQYADSADYACSNCMDADFFEELIVNDTPRWESYPPIGLNRVRNDTARILNDRTNWMQICDTVKAKGVERYFVIGNFEDSTSIIYESTSPRGELTFYYLDDVSVRKLTGGGQPRRYSVALCPSELPYTLNGRAGYLGYEWSTGDTTESLSITAAGTYTLTHAYECGSITDTFVVEVKAYEVPIGVDSISRRVEVAACETELPLWLEGRAGFSSYHWSNGEEVADIWVDSVGQETYVVRYDSGYANGCGSLCDTFEVKVEGYGPEIDLGENRLSCEQERFVPVLLEAGGVHPRYAWSTGENTASIWANDTGTYWVAAPYEICPDRTDTIHIAGCLPPSFEVRLGNVFTPNEDGVYDSWAGQYPTEIAFESLRVLDRWGRRVFQTNDPTLSWQGQVGGRPAPEGVYYYELRYVRVGAGEESVQRGVVTLLR